MGSLDISHSNGNSEYVDAHPKTEISKKQSIQESCLLT